MRGFLIVSAIIFVLGVPCAAQAKTAAHLACETAENTSDIMNCVKRRYDEAQTRLKAVYDQLVVEERAPKDEAIVDGQSDDSEEKAKPEKKVPAVPAISVSDVQKNWIAYRDQECAWQREQAEESLKRIRELSCLADLTDKRADTLALVLTHGEAQSDDPVQYGAAVRWMNALAADHPDIFWRYGDTLRSDLNCDGRDEIIIPGLTTLTRDVRLRNSDPYIVKSHLAIIDEPATGRPISKIFDLPVSADEDDGVLCDSEVALSIVSETTEVIEGEEKSCEVRLQIESGACPAQAIVVQDGAFEFLPISNE